MSYEEQYLEKIKILDAQISDKSFKLEKLYEEYKKVASDDSLSDKNKKLEVLKKQILRLEYVMFTLKKEKEYARIGTRETEAEKLRVYDSFDQDLKEVLNSNSTICFHGCRYIYLVKDIIQSGKIQSSIDRLGLQTSYDVDDQISVTTINNIETTTKSYLGLTNSPSQPAGAMFVITPKDEKEIESSSRMIMGNVDFKENPERLLYIVTTSENKELIKKWCIESGILLEKVCTYDEFLNLALDLNSKTI